MASEPKFPIRKSEITCTNTSAILGLAMESFIALYSAVDVVVWVYYIIILCSLDYPLSSVP